MRSQQKGHDNSGFAFIMQDLGGIFENYKDLPILSMAVSDEGMKYANDLLRNIGFISVFQYNLEVYPSKTNEIPYATQLFTPKWIVKYMVENTVGRYVVDNKILDEEQIRGLVLYLLI